MRFRFSVIVLLFMVLPALAQFRNSNLGALQNSFKSFDYEGVITKSSQILKNADDLNYEQLLNVYKYRALSYYSLMQMDLAFRDFVEMLKIDPSYTLDPMTTSPKIINFFNEIRQVHQAGNSVVEKTVVKTDTVMQYQDNKMFVANCAFRSIVLPGWGHLYNQQKQKGWIFLAGNIVSLGTCVYLIGDCAQKRSDYLAETHSEYIQQKYDQYDGAYKKRNIALAVYSVFWLYTQTDLLLFSDLSPEKIKGFSMMPTIDHNGSFSLSCVFNW